MALAAPVLINRKKATTARRNNIASEFICILGITWKCITPIAAQRPG